MEYPRQRHEAEVEVTYRLHSYNGVFHYTDNLKDARAAYKQEKRDSGMAMITKHTSTTIILETWEHVQGSL